MLKLFSINLITIKIFTRFKSKIVLVLKWREYLLPSSRSEFYMDFHSMDHL
jgi:hypothetical protein